MFILQGPTLGIQVTVLMPSPEWNNSYALKAQSTLKRSMNNVVYTYVKNPSTYHLKYMFTLTQAKMLEVLAFIKTFYGVQVTIIDHNNLPFAGYITNEPASFQAVMINEINEIILEFDAIFA